MDSTVKEGRFPVGEEGQTRRASLGEAEGIICTNQQPPLRDGAIPDPVWVKSKWLLAFPRVLVDGQLTSLQLVFMTGSKCGVWFTVA